MVDHRTWNTRTQLLYITSSFMKDFLQFVAMKLEKESKSEIFISKKEFWSFLRIFYKNSFSKECEESHTTIST